MGEQVRYGGRRLIQVDKSANRVYELAASG